MVVRASRTKKALNSSITPARNSARLFLRLLVSISIGIISGLVCYGKLSIRNVQAADFTWAWFSARVLLQGGNPYTAMPLNPTYPLDAPLFYPIFAPLVAVPVAMFTPILAGALFFGVSSALLAWVFTVRDFSNLLVFTTSFYWMALENCQWSPLITAVMFLPWLSFILLAKPNLGILGMLVNPTRCLVLVCGVAGILSLFIWPWWFGNWWHAVTVYGHNAHKSPVTILPLLLLLLVTWRSMEGRLSLAMIVLPQNLIFYDQLPLWLVTKSTRERIILVILTWVGFLGWLNVSGPYASRAAWWIVIFVYVPVLLLLLLPRLRRLF